MKRLNGNKMRIVLVGFVIIVVLGNKIANSDFTFGEPTNLGSVVNGQYDEQMPSISADGLELYFMSRRPGGLGTWDIWVAKRETTSDLWAEPVNVGQKVNSSIEDWAPCISADGLELYFEANRSGSLGGSDLWMSMRETKEGTWSDPVNLGPAVNSSYRDADPSISTDGLSLYFSSNRPGGSGFNDLWMTTRPTVSDPWGSPMNLGTSVNSSEGETGPSISSDGLVLFFSSTRPDGKGLIDLWLTRRSSISDPWGTPVNLGPVVNQAFTETAPSISADGRTLYFSDYYYAGIRHGGHGGADLYTVSVNPIVDLNSDLKVDLEDMHIMVDNWGQNNPLCDIGPMPWGDGIVDIQDFIVLNEHLYQIAAHWKLDETDGNIAYDSHGDYDGAINGNPSWQPTGGKKGGSLFLDGIDDYIDIPFILDPSKGSFSVFAWIYCWTPGQVIISQKGESDGTWLGIDSSGNLMTGLVPHKTGWVTPQPLVSESVITDIQWHHVGLVWDGSYRALYVDGIEVAKDTAAQNPLKSADGGLYIGADKDLEAGTFFSGMIDDVRIYKQALTAEEIAALFQ